MGQSFCYNGVRVGGAVWIKKKEDPAQLRDGRLQTDGPKGRKDLKGTREESSLQEGIRNEEDGESEGFMHFFWWL